jgi:predicted nucleic acid-binding protein
MTADDLTFVDTDILVYARDRSKTHKQPLAQALLERLWASRTGALSTQILQEFHVVATRKFDPPMRRRAAREIVALYAT